MHCVGSEGILEGPVRYLQLAGFFQYPGLGSGGVFQGEDGGGGFRSQIHRKDTGGAPGFLEHGDDRGAGGTAHGEGVRRGGAVEEGGQLIDLPVDRGDGCQHFRIAEQGGLLEDGLELMGQNK